MSATSPLSSSGGGSGQRVSTDALKQHLEAPLLQDAPPKLSTATRRRAKAIATLRIGLASIAWLGASSGIVIANRWIMVELKWPYPMTVAAMGMAVSGLFSFIVIDVLRMVPNVDMTYQFYLTRVLPIGALQALAMWLSNSLYLYLTVAFIEMCRAMLPLFIMLALYLASLETPTSTMVRAVGLTGIGCMISAYGEVHLSSIGMLCLLGNFTMESMRLVLMQVLLVGHEFSALQGLKLIGPAAVLCLISTACVTELPRMRQNGAWQTVVDNWPVFAFAASMGLCVNLVSNIVIKVAGSTALKVLGAMRGPILVLSSVLFLREHISLLELFGYNIALVGFVWYNYAKSQEMAKALQASAKPSEQAK